MSNYERHTGTIQKVDFKGNIDEFANWLGLKELPSYCEDWEEYFRYESEEYILRNDNIYRIDNKEMPNESDIFEWHFDGDTIRYAVSFYNGGCDLSELLFDILDEAADASQTIEESKEELQFKEVESVSYSDDFWYALDNGYIDLDEILVDNSAKKDLERAIETVRDFRYLLESQDFFEEI